MKEYDVTVPFPCFVVMKVKAATAEDALEYAEQNAFISEFAGNGGYDKLIGVTNSCDAIYAGDIPLDVGGFSIEVEEVSNE